MLKKTPFILFVGVLVVLAGVLGGRWTVAAAGYIDEPAGVIEGDAEGGTIGLGERGNGSITFANCEGKCIVKDGLPLFAKDFLGDIDGTIINKAYVRTVDADGNPIDAPYTICFDSPGILLEFVIGTGWVAVAGDTTPGTDVCYNASGEGVFVFVH